MSGHSDLNVRLSSATAYRLTHVAHFPSLREDSSAGLEIDPDMCDRVVFALRYNILNAENSYPRWTGSITPDSG